MLKQRHCWRSEDGTRPAPMLIPNGWQRCFPKRMLQQGTVQIHHGLLRDMSPFEAPVSASTSDASISRRGTARSTSSHLRPEDAFLTYSPPYRSTNKDGASDGKRKRDNRGSRNASRRRPRTWKKLLWVKQACMRRAAARDAIYHRPNTETVRSRQLHG